MRRAVRWLVWVVAVLVGLPALLAAGLLVALNTDPGRRLAEREIARVSGGEVELSGLAGRFPDALQIARIEVRDDRGPWLTVRDAALDWMPSRLLGWQVHVIRLAASDVTVARLPGSPAGQPPAGPASSGAIANLPLPVVVDALHVGRLDIAAPVAGAAAVLTADGSARLTSSDAGSGELSVRRLDGGGTYRLHANVTAAGVSGALVAEEPAHGLASAAANLPELGALSLHASADGPWSSVATRLALTAGQLAASAEGRVNVTGRAADLDVTAHAPAMAPRADLAWRSVQVDVHVHGRWTAPHATGSVDIDGLAAAGASIGKLSATLAGDLGRVTLTATADALRIPGPAPALFAATPVTLRADARLDEPARPVSFALTHPLLSVAGRAQTAGTISAQAHVDLPDLAPLAAVGAPPIQGHATLDLTATLPHGEPSLTGQGVIAVTGGAAPLPALLGSAARISVAAGLHGNTLEVSRFELDAGKLSLAAHGSVADKVDVTWQAGLPDLSVLAPAVQGNVAAQGRVHGPLTDLAADADLTGAVASAQVPRGPVQLSIAAQGLPDTPSAVIHAEGRFDAAPLALEAAVDRRADGTLHLAIGRADWKSLHADGTLTLAPAASVPAGRVTLRMDRLADLSSLLGQPISGSLSAEIAAEGQQVRLQATARNAAFANSAGVATVGLDVRVRNPLGSREIDGSLEVAGLRASGIAGTARLQVSGPPAALALQLRSTLTGLGDGPLQASAAGRLDATGHNLGIAALQADWHGETLRLLAPTRIGFGDGIRIDRTRLGLGGAVLEVAGKVSPALDLTASLHNLPADLVSAVVPNLRAAGVVQADARLTGTPQRPDGRLHLAATGLHLRSGPGSAMPPAAVLADATLAGTTAQVSARLTAGRNGITVAGSAPLVPGGALALHAGGAVDLTLFDPLLAANGRRVRGKVTLDGTVTGSLAAPRADGTLRLANGDVEDFVQGIHIAGIDALLEGSGDSLRLAHLTGRAGPGTISASGTVGLGDAMPVDLTITGKNARPLASDLMTADLDLDLALRGDLLGRLGISGSVTVLRANINVPERLPATVAVLQVRRPGQPPPPPPVPAPDIGLDVTLRAPGQVFIRGRGLEAELQGRITLAGSLAALQPSGRFTLRRGTFNLAGQVLTFTSGDIGFDGGGLDPTLNLVATSSTATVTATLTVTGTASAPKITLSSVPDLPQDEILAQLLFHQSSGSLNGLQLAQSAAALAQISGVGGGFNPLNSIRRKLGLDRLAVGSTPTGTGATLEAGRYVAPGVYVGAKQGSAGGGTQATVQIDLLRGLKLEATAGTGGTQSATGATATDDPNGSSIGLTYQFNY